MWRRFATVSKCIVSVWNSVSSMAKRDGWSQAQFLRHLKQKSRQTLFWAKMGRFLLTRYTKKPSAWLTTMESNHRTKYTWVGNMGWFTKFDQGRQTHFMARSTSERAAKKTSSGKIADYRSCVQIQASNHTYTIGWKRMGQDYTPDTWCSQVPETTQSLKSIRPWKDYASKAFGKPRSMAWH